MTLRDLHRTQGAQLADDGIPLHYGDVAAEYRALHDGAVLFDRSHEGRLRLHGQDRHDLLNRISTNLLLDLQPSEGRPTIFTNANARILDRILVYEFDAHLLVLTEPGRGAAVQQHLQRNIFFGDTVQVESVADTTIALSLHGKQAAQIIDSLITLPDFDYASASLTFENHAVSILRREPFVDHRFVCIVPRAVAVSFYQHLLQIGQQAGLRPAGSLTFNTARIEAGRLARPELNADYIPLELGLWNEVNFAKGCYAGQEIIARMESRQRLARIAVAVTLTNAVQSPISVQQDGKTVGKLTSAVTTPTNTHVGIAVVKAASAMPGTTLHTEDGTKLHIREWIGSQPAFVLENYTTE